MRTLPSGRSRSSGPALNVGIGGRTSAPDAEVLAGAHRLNELCGGPSAHSRRAVGRQVGGEADTPRSDPRGEVARWSAPPICLARSRRPAPPAIAHSRGGPRAVARVGAGPFGVISFGVWQSLQPPSVTRYSPRLIGSLPTPWATTTGAEASSIAATVTFTTAIFRNIATSNRVLRTILAIVDGTRQERAVMLSRGGGAASVWPAAPPTADAILPIAAMPRSSFVPARPSRRRPRSR